MDANFKEATEQVEIVSETLGELYLVLDKVNLQLDMLVTILEGMKSDV